MKSFVSVCGLLAALIIGFSSAQDDPDTGEHVDWPRVRGIIFFLFRLLPEAIVSCGGHKRVSGVGEIPEILPE